MVWRAIVEITHIQYTWFYSEFGWGDKTFESGQLLDDPVPGTQVTQLQLIVVVGVHALAPKLKVFRPHWCNV